ncbi:MAG: hypothetical protein R2695_07855 [Acidimicrobiales bacterium]
MLSLERLEELTAAPPQRIALSATQRPLDEIARFLGGSTVAADGTIAPRPVTVVDAGARKELDIEVVVPIDDMGALGERVEAPLGAGDGGPAPPQHLALDASAPARPRPVPPIDDRVHQRPPPGGAARHPAQRAGARRAPARGRAPGRGGGGSPATSRSAGARRRGRSWSRPITVRSPGSGASRSKTS